MADEIVTEILEMTVSIERSVFKADGFPRGKIFQSAKAAVPRRGTPEQVSADLQKFIQAELDKMQALEGNGQKKEQSAEDAGTALLGAGQGSPGLERPPAGEQAPPAGAPAQGQGKGSQGPPPQAPPRTPPQAPPPAGNGKAPPLDKDGRDPRPLSEGQRKKIYAMENHKRGGKEVVKSWLDSKNIRGTKDLRMSEAYNLIEVLNALPDED